MFVYGAAPGVVQTTSGTPNTEVIGMSFTSNNDGSAGRALGFLGLYVHGRGAGLTAISGLSFRIKQMSLSNSSSGSTVFLNLRDPGGTNSLVVSGAIDGTPNGSATLRLSIGCGAAGASGWFAQNAQAVIQLAYTATVQSCNVAVASGLASMNYEESAELITV